MSIMKIKILLLISVALFFAFEKIHAQEKLKFTSTNYAGLLISGTKNSFQLQTINGLRYKEFSAGIGVGMDNYYYKSIPVFLHLTRKISIKNFSPFIYTDIGFNLPEDRKAEEEFWETSYYSKGLYFDLGIGYSLPLYKKMSMTFALGYSQKHLEEKRERRYMGWPGGVIHDLPTEYYSYAFRRISLKAGLSF